MANNVDPTRYEFIEIAPAAELPRGERLIVDIDGIPIVIFNVDDKFYAIGDLCTHDNGPLGEGELDGHAIICPRHGARFDVRNGKALTLPAVTDTLWYPVRVTEDGIIEIGLL